MTGRGSELTGVKKIDMLINFNDLFQRYGIHPSGVLHVGANIGEEAPVYHQLGVKHAIFVEANPDIFLRLKSNISQYPHYTAMCYAVTDVNNQEVVLHISNNGSQSSSILELGTHKQQHPDVYYTHDIIVRTRRIDDLLHSLYIEDVGAPHYDFLNIDIQGAELKALQGAGTTLEQFKWMYLEVNREPLYLGCALIDEIDDYVSKFGFRRVETFWVGGWGDALYVKQS